MTNEFRNPKIKEPPLPPRHPTRLPLGGKHPDLRFVIRISFVIRNSSCVIENHRVAIERKRTGVSDLQIEQLTHVPPGSLKDHNLVRARATFETRRVPAAQS